MGDHGFSQGMSSSLAWQHLDDKVIFAWTGVTLGRDPGIRKWLTLGCGGLGIGLPPEHLSGTRQKNFFISIHNK